VTQSPPWHPGRGGPTTYGPPPPGYDLPTAGGQLTRAVAVRRWLVDSLGAQLVPFLHLLDGLWQRWDQPYRQCLHDKAADTAVVKVMAWR